MFAKERKEMREEQKELRADFRRENDEQNRVIAEQKEEMKRLHKRLHRADLQNKEAHRQRDEKQSQELEAKISSAIRHSNNTNSSLEIELKKLMDHQIDHYLVEIALKK